LTARVVSTVGYKGKYGKEIDDREKRMPRMWQFRHRLYGSGSCKWGWRTDERS
jgi:hypothetical protein